MTIPAQLITDVKAWLNFEYSDELIESWVRVAFEAMSDTLRCSHMVTIETAEIDVDRVLLPVGWLEMDFLRDLEGGPIHFRSREDFYRTDLENDGYYTVSGNHLIMGGSPTDSVPKQVELTFFEKLPTSFDETHFMFTSYYTLTLYGVLAASADYSEDDENALKWNGVVANRISAINDQYKSGRVAGSRLRRPRRYGS